MRSSASSFPVDLAGTREVRARRDEQEAQERARADAELLVRFQQGAVGSAEAFHDRVAPLIKRTLCQILGRDDEEFEDILQRSFERVVKDIIAGKYRDRGTLGSFTAAQTARVVLLHLRIRQKRSRLSWVATQEETTRHKAAVLSGAKPYLLVDIGAQARAFRRALAELPQDVALLLVLHEVTRHDLGEIALLMNLTPRVAKARLTQGRRDLAAALRSALGVSDA